MNDDKGPSSLSIAALITGIFGLSIIPIILGSIDLIRIKNGLKSSKGIAFDIAGIILGVIGIIAIIIVIIAIIILVINISPENTIFKILLEYFR